jgi:hypothetical protein
LERAHKEYAQLEHQARATKQELTNQLQEERNRSTALEREAQTKAGEHASQLQEERDRSRVLERQVKARWEELRKAFEISPADALVKVIGKKEPTLLTLIDSSSGQHRVTVQIQSNQDFSFWVPKGSYQVHFARTDISAKMGELVSGKVVRGRLRKEYELKDTSILTIIMEGGAESEEVSAEEWGKAKPSKKP